MDDNRILLLVRSVTLFAIIAIVVYVAINPDLVYRPTPKAVLFLLVACVPAILFASEAAARFELKLPTFAASAGGAAAIVFISLLMLDRIAKPEQYVAVYRIFDANDQPVQGLNRPGALEFLPTEGGLRVTSYVDSNALVVIFPEQVREVVAMVRPVLSGPAQRLTLRYDGATERDIKLEAPRQ
jgi:hypothetical protein